MNSRMKQVATVVKLSAKYRCSAWSSIKTLSKLNAGLRGESTNSPVILDNEDEGKDSLVGINESSMVADETCSTSWSEVGAKLRAERISRPQIALSNEDEDDDSPVGINESSMVVDETCNTSWSELGAKLRAERISRPQIALPNENEDDDSFVGMDESSMVVDETCNTSWSELAAKLRAERINRPPIALSNEDEDDDSFMSMDESSMVVDETYISSWSDEIAKLRTEKINHQQIIFPDDDEDENNIESMEKSSIAVDETRFSSSCSSVPENYSKFKRPSSVRSTEVENNRVSLIGSICMPPRFKKTDSGQSLLWTSIDMRDENCRISGRLKLYFLDELADIARKHLRLTHCVYISGEFDSQQYPWVKAKDLKFIQWPDTHNTVNNSQPEAKAEMESTTFNPVKDSKPEANAKAESTTIKTVKDITTAQKTPTAVKEYATSNKPVPPKEEVAATTKPLPKPLPEMMAEDVIPEVNAILEMEEDICDIELVFEDNKLEGSFAKGGKP